MLLRSLLLVFSYSACLAAGQRVAAVHAAVGNFSYEILQRNVKGDANTVFSPYSIISALGMCFLGSQGSTSASFKTILNFGGLEDAEIKAAFKTITEQILQKNAFVLESANRLYVDKTFPLKRAFQEDVNEVFHADAHNADFKGNAQDVQRSINSFVSNRTRGLIPQILNSPLPPTTKMALVNALYFKGTWPKKLKQAFLEKKFNAHTCDPTQPIVTHQKAKWLRTRRDVRYTESATLDANLVELPYTSEPSSNQKASLIIILPSEKHRCDVPAWVKHHLKWSDVVEAVKSMEETYTEVQLPEFAVEAEFELSNVLSEIGLAPAFSDEANFNGIVESGPANIKIDKVIHKAKMIVDEYGTEAAAATGVTFTTLSLTIEPPPKKEVFVDRSFVAIIVLRQPDDSIVPLFTSVVNQV